MSISTDPKVLTRKLFPDGKSSATQEEACEAWGVGEATYYNYARIVMRAGYGTYVGKKTRGSKRDLAITEAGRRVVDGRGTPPINDTHKQSLPVIVNMTPELLEQFKLAANALALFNQKSQGIKLSVSMQVEKEIQP